VKQLYRSHVFTEGSTTGEYGTHAIFFDLNDLPTQELAAVSQLFGQYRVDQLEVSFFSIIGANDEFTSLVTAHMHNDWAGSWAGDVTDRNTAIMRTAGNLGVAPLRRTLKPYVNTSQNTADDPTIRQSPWLDISAINAKHYGVVAGTFQPYDIGQVVTMNYLVRVKLSFRYSE
jgi:hypothetical protein